MKAKRIGLLGFDGVMALDLVGPVDAFTSAEIEEPNGQPSRCYEVVIIGFSDKFFVSESGVVFKPHKTMSNAPALDTLILPGGKGLRVPETQARVAEWIKNRINRIRRVATVCTGAYGLAATGLLDGRCVTTHWRYALDLARRFPKLKVNPNALYLKDGKFYTGAGITAGIDLSLALIEEDFGPRVALAVARELVVYLKRPGGQEQFSEPLRFQVRSSDRFAELAAWIQGHLQQDLSAETLANRACLSPRHFSRRFKDAFGSPPAAFVEGLRLSEARERLTLPDQTIESVADSVGFKSADAFRRAFERRFGIAPSNYRKNFAMRSES
ncbi:MAG TPA: helix-turn-helix domain-containing protein [Blastocatellia bacterium]|nr:helix-turn-helix domain-containing protein [Blastocatellia bacterium]